MEVLNTNLTKSKPWKRLVILFIFPLLIVTLATLLRFWPLGALELRVMWVTYYPAVVFSGLLFGFIPGLLTTILSTLAVLLLSYTVIPFIEESADWLGLFIFFINGSLISLTSGLTHRSKNIATKLKEEAVKSKKDLEYKILERTKELTASENQLRSLFNFSPFPIMVHNQDGVVIMINKVWTDLTGYTKSDIPTIALWVEKAYGEEKSIVTEEIEDLFNLEDRVDEGEYVVRTKDGRFIIWDFSSSPLGAMEDGKKVIVSMAKDVTQKVSIEKEINRTKKFYESIIEGVQDGIWVTDKNDIVYYANIAMEKISGFPREKITGNNILKDFPEETNGELIEYYLKAKEENRAIGFNVKVKTLEGKDTFQKGWFIPHYQDNIFMGIICTVHDITDQRQIEVKLRDSEKKQQESENKLRQSQKMDAVGQLAGGVAHDFNNILAGIIGISEILADKVKENQELNKYANIIIDSCIQASELTQKLLSFSHKDQVQIEIIDIHDSIKKVTTMLEHIIDKRIEIKTTLKADLTLINVDKTQIENAILNLCINARDAMPLGGLLRIQTRNISYEQSLEIPFPNVTQGEYIEIDVTDTGHGMSKEIQERILEPFFTTKELGKGTGLGLSIVYSTIKKNKGYINVYSEVDKGSTFKIYLPITKNQVIDENEKKKDTIIHGSGTILFADDESILRLITSQILLDLGYKVILAENGEEAVTIYKEKRSEIDLVILDVVMPKLSGRDAFYQIKEINPDVKVIISSGFPEDTDTSKLIKDGVHCFIQKPYLKSDLANKISEILS